MSAETNLQPAPLQNAELPITGEQGSDIDPIRTETIFSRMPLHVLSKSGTRPQINIEKRSGDGRTVEEKWKVSYNEEYGPAKQLAYDVHTLVIERAIEEAFDEARRTSQPFPRMIPLSSLNDVASRLGPNAETRDTNRIKKALSQNAGILITAFKKYRGSDGVEYVIEGVFTPYGIYFFGQKLPGGERADQVYINLNDAYFEAWSRAATRPLDYNYKAQLPPIPRRFYELVSYAMYGAIKNNHPTARYRYSEFCKTAPQLRYDTFEKVKKQMYKIHKPHLDSQYIVKIKYEQTTDEQDKPDWWMIYTPGPRAYTEFAVFTGKKPKLVAASQAGESASVLKPRRPRQRRLNLKPAPDEQLELETTSPPPTIIHYGLISELEKRGISSTDARQILASLSADQPVLDQLEWGDFLIQQSHGKITNPPGFYISLIKQNKTPPPTFETSEQRKAKQQAELERQQALQLETEAEITAQEVAEAQLDQLQADSPDDYQELYRQAEAQLFAAYPKMAELARSRPDSAIHEGAIRARIKQFLADDWQPPVAAPAASTPEGTFAKQALDPVLSQPDRVQDTTPSVSPFALHLEQVLSTVKLPAPASQTGDPKLDSADWQGAG